MKLLTSLVVLCIFTISQTIADHADIGLSPSEIIANHGYVSETHQVTTDDGYIVTLYRIPHGIKNNNTIYRPPVLLMHGFLVCSGEFVALGPERGLAYILADAGYDVWLPNSRGTTPSRNHTSIDVNKDPEVYFDFTWHEIGIYDIAKSVDYILGANGDESLHYIGHSQGSTVFLVLASTKPEYNKKIKLASLMAPVAIIEHFPNIIIQEICKYLDSVWKILQKYNFYEVPGLKALREAVTTHCVNYPDNYTDPLCDIIYNNLLPKIDKVFLPIVLSNCPSAAGIKQLVHFGQLVRDGGFRQFDHGNEKNLEIYGTETPPNYDLSKITAPVAFYYAKNDGLIAVEDEITLVSMIPNVIINYLVPNDSFVHVDFAMSNDVVELVYNKLLSIMSEY